MDTQTNETFFNANGEKCRAFYSPERRQWYAYSTDLPHHVTSGKESQAEAVQAAQDGNWMSIYELGDMIRQQQRRCL